MDLDKNTSGGVPDNLRDHAWFTATPERRLEMLAVEGWGLIAFVAVLVVAWIVSWFQ